MSSSPQTDSTVSKKWTVEEDTLLEILFTTHGPHWVRIAQNLPGRSARHVMTRWKKVLDPMLKKGQWTPEEDATLVSLVAQFGESKPWAKIEHILHRNGKQARERWENHLSPEISKSEWSAQEDSKLLQVYFQMGPKWSSIARLLPGRTANRVKNRFNSFLRSKIQGCTDFDSAWTAVLCSATRKRQKGASIVQSTNVKFTGEEDEDENVPPPTSNVLFPISVANSKKREEEEDEFSRDVIDDLLDEWLLQQEVHSPDNDWPARELNNEDFETPPKATQISGCESDSSKRCLDDFSCLKSKNRKRVYSERDNDISVNEEGYLSYDSDARVISENKSLHKRLANKCLCPWAFKYHPARFPVEEALYGVIELNEIQECISCEDDDVVSHL